MKCLDDQKKTYFFLYFFIFLISVESHAKIEAKKNIFGLPGLIDMPTAGVFDDGEVSFTSSKFGPNLRNTLGFQAFPRVYTTFRYSGIGDKSTGWKEKSGYSIWDRSFDLKIDLFRNNKIVPDTAIGFNDIIGTGKFSGEYLVSSKTIMNNVTLTGGLGWGRLGTANKLTSGYQRNNNTGGDLGGLLRYEQLFQGDIGVFGGVDINTSLNGLSLQIEMSSDNYTYDKAYINQRPKSQINYGLKYKINDNINFSSSYNYGNYIGLNLNISASPSKLSFGDYLEGTSQPFYSLPLPVNDNIEKIWKSIIEDLRKEKITTIAHKNLDDEVIVVIKNYHYSSHTQAIGKTLRVLSKHVPTSKKTFTVILSEFDIPITQVSFDRNEISLIIDAPNAELLSKKIVTFKEAPTKLIDAKINYENNFKLDWSVSPYYRLHLFDPDRPIYYDLGPELYFNYKFKPSLMLSGNIETSIVTTFDEVWRSTKGNLPKVRTDMQRYLNHTDTRIRDLLFTSFYKLKNNIFGRLNFGYFEPMYAGLSSEILYQPLEANVGFGIEMNYVRARDYDQGFKLRPLNGLSNINGHLTSYWDTQFYNYIAQLDVGRYLAGDNGGTFTLTRNFNNGWLIGGFFSLTDASAKDFGEGSFDKGFFINIPFNQLTPFETRYKLSEKIKPIEGDGGAKLGNPFRLYDIVNEHRKNNYYATWDRIWR